MKTLLAAALLALSAAAPARAAPEPPAGAPQHAEAAASQQLLVMLNLPPQHYRPDAGYGGSYPGDSGHAARRRVAEDLARQHGLRLQADWPMPAIGVDCYVMEHDGSGAIGPALERLARDPRVVWAQPINNFRGLDGGDPLYPAQPAARFWRLADLHKATTGRDVRVAVVDSGIDGAHPDLAGQVVLRENFVDASPDAAEAHGTAVAGIIAAREGNGAGIAGVAPAARLLALRACWPGRDGTTRCNSFTLGKAINFAIMNHARIINLSLSGPSDRLLRSLLDVAQQRGMTVVGAADPQRADGGFPASHPGVIAVASGPAAGDGLRAPGADIPTTLPGACWGFVSGSSYAAAHVSGLAALMAQLHHSASAPELRRDIVTVRRPAPLVHSAMAPDPQAQAGNIDACATIARITGACVCSCTTTAAMKGSNH
jgi:subtilisin family serine protease